MQAQVQGRKKRKRDLSSKAKQMRRPPIKCQVISKAAPAKQNRDGKLTEHQQAERDSAHDDTIQQDIWDAHSSDQPPTDQPGKAEDDRKLDGDGKGFAG